MGKIASMEAILEFRDKKIDIIESYLNKKDLENKIKAVITISSINPGPIKNNKIYDHITTYGKKLCLDLFKENIIEEIYIKEDGGISYLYKTSFNNIYEIITLKKKFIDIEDNDKLGRLLDLDIIVKDKSITRDSLSLGNRQCLLCEKKAHFCNRQRSHKMEDIIKKINQLYVNNFK